jgi:hypothetical protein
MEQEATRSDYPHVRMPEKQIARAMLAQCAEQITNEQDRVADICKHPCADASAVVAKHESPLPLHTHTHISNVRMEKVTQ